MKPATIGFRDHSGWAIAVVLGGTAEAPEILARERITLIPAQLPRQPYHAVAEQGAPRSVIAEVEAAALAGAAGALGRLREQLAGDGYELTAVSVAAGTHAIPASLDAILRSHTLLHSAEGQLFREALAEAGAAAGLRVVRFVQREVFSLAGAPLGMDASAMEARLTLLGKPLGPPWQKDHKEAVAAALLAVSS